MGNLHTLFIAHDFDLETNMVLVHRDRSFIKLAKLKLMSIFTDEEVDPIFTKTTLDSLPVTTRSSPKSGMTNGMASSHRNDFTSTGRGEAAPTNAVPPAQERTREYDGLVKIISELQENAKSAERSMKNLKTTFEEELDLIVESISAFTSRTNEVDALKLEVKTLKRRLQRLEQGNPSSRSPYTINDQAEESTRQSRLAKVANLVARKPAKGRPGVAAPIRRPLRAKKRAEESLGSNALDKTSFSKSDPLPTLGMSKTPLKTFPAARINQQAHQDTGSQSSSSDTESDVRPIPATRPSITEFPSPSSISGTSAVALEFEQGPTKSTLAPFRRKPASAGSSKNRKVIPSSEVEDEIQMSQHGRTSKNPLRRGGLVPSRGVRRVGRYRNLGSLSHDPSKEWPDLDEAPNAFLGRKGGIVRRGVGGSRMLSIRSEPKRRSTSSLLDVIYTANDGQRYDLKGRRLNEDGIPLRPDGRPDRRYLKKTIRDQSGVLRFAPAEPAEPVESVENSFKEGDGFPDETHKTDAVEANNLTIRESVVSVENSLKQEEQEEQEDEQGVFPDETPKMGADETNLIVTEPPVGSGGPPPKEMPKVSLKRARSEGEAGASTDDLDTRPVKRLRDDEAEEEEEEEEEEDMAELRRRWGIRQQSA